MKDWHYYVILAVGIVILAPLSLWAWRWLMGCG